MKKDKKDWFRLKRYPHIGLPLKLRHRGWVEEYISNIENVESHSFYPFIHRKISVRKFRREKNDDGTRSINRCASYKDREVFYANHLDSMIYSYYSELLTSLYDKKLFRNGFSDAVTAYRSIPLNNLLDCRNKCNIDFANDIFSFISNNRTTNLVAITFDITSFFDNLDHNLLKKSWCDLLSLKRLPKDHYAVYKNLTKFSYVQFEDIFELFKNKILVEKNGKIKSGNVPRADLLKEKNAVAFCSLKDFKEIKNNNLIKSNRYRTNNDFNQGNLRNKGIPQGSPISATLANIYLFEFDKFIYNYITSLGGMYRRYSDDMVVVVNENYRDEIYQLLIDEIKKFKLDIQPSKTQIFYFKEYMGIYGCKELNIYTEQLSEKTKFEYLGFAFDGNWVYLKSSGLSKYYRKMKRSIRRGGFYAKYGSNKVPSLFKNRLYKRYTILGAQRKMVIKKLPNLPNKYYRTGEYDWGNYLTYAKLAERVFSNNKIKSQIRNHWKKFHELVKEKQKEIDSHHSK